jgi:hypothetical protein
MLGAVHLSPTLGPAARPVDSTGMFKYDKVFDFAIA